MSDLVVDPGPVTYKADGSAPSYHGVVTVILLFGRAPRLKKPGPYYRPLKYKRVAQAFGSVPSAAAVETLKVSFCTFGEWDSSDFWP